MRIQLVLADDWELRGDGSGDMRVIQFATIRRLCEVYEACGLRASFNVEVLQQLVHRRLGDENRELGRLAAEWEEVVRDVYQRGHDVQLHLHPQWTNARYEGGKWSLSGSWSILDYEPDRVEEMILEGMEYLEELLRPLDPSYRCVSFRSGSWCIAPGDHVLNALAKAGIVFDMSIAEGLHYDTGHIQLDYRMIDEPFRPYYPRMNDARRVADEPQSIVCVPTHTFSAGKPLVRGVARALRKRTPLGSRMDRFVAPNDVLIPNRGYGTDYSRRNWDNRRGTASSKRRVSDLSALSFGQMRQMLADIRRRARATGWALVPVVLENHTKDIGNFVPFERLAAHISSAPDLEVLTLTELARNIEGGVYPIRWGENR
jgi:hypothetical protein